jgi:hypothetical protein
MGCAAKERLGTDFLVAKGHIQTNLHSFLSLNAETGFLRFKVSLKNISDCV